MIKRILVHFLLLASFLSQGVALAQEKTQFPRGDFSALQRTGTARVTEIIDPQTLQLHDGRIVRLAGLDFPDYALHEAGEYSLLSVNILRDMLANESVNIYQTRNKDLGRLNRMGHHIAHIEREKDGAWVQGTLLSLGLARVRTTQRNPEMAAQMYAWEHHARSAKIGLWQENAYKIISPEEAESAQGHFAIIEGRIESTSLKKNRVYLGFGKNWRDDFTVSIPPGDKRKFSRQNINLLELGGSTVRVRGWLRSYNGPYMEIDHPEALEILKKSEEDATPFQAPQEDSPQTPAQ